MATIDGVLRVRASSTDIGSPRAPKAWHSPQRRSPGSVIIGEMGRIFGGGDETAKLARRPEALAGRLGGRAEEGVGGARAGAAPRAAAAAAGLAAIYGGGASAAPSERLFGGVAGGRVLELPLDGMPIV